MKIQYKLAFLFHLFLLGVLLYCTFYWQKEAKDWEMVARESMEEAREAQDIAQEAIDISREYKFMLEECANQ